MGGNGVSGVGGGGALGPMGQAIVDGAVDGMMMNEMNVPVQAGDNKGAQARFQKVRDLAGQLSPEAAGELLDHLNTNDKSDPVAQKIRHTFSEASIEKLKGDLRVKSGRATLGEVLTHTAEELGKLPKNATVGEVLKRTAEEIVKPKDSKSRKAETDLQGQMKMSNLFDKLTADQRAEKMFKAADVMHKDPDAILSALGDLTASQMKQLQKVFPEKYGVSLDTFLKNQLHGPRLNLALDMVASGNTVGATNFHVIE